MNDNLEYLLKRVSDQVTDKMKEMPRGADGKIMNPVHLDFDFQGSIEPAALITASETRDSFEAKYRKLVRLLKECLRQPSGNTIRELTQCWQNTKIELSVSVPLNNEIILNAWIDRMNTHIAASVGTSQDVREMLRAGELADARPEVMESVIKNLLDNPPVLPGILNPQESLPDYQAENPNSAGILQVIHSIRYAFENLFRLSKDFERVLN